jgi:hypothetical protein
MASTTANDRMTAEPITKQARDERSNKIEDQNSGKSLPTLLRKRRHFASMHPAVGLPVGRQRPAMGECRERAGNWLCDG